MNQQITSCHHCGASIKASYSRCEYCGTLLHANEVNNKQPTSPLTPDVHELNEYRKLKRPKPEMPLEASGCSLIFGLIWTAFSSIFLIVGIGFFVSETINYNRLLREGVIAIGTVTRLEVDDSDDSTSYYVHYQFRGEVNGDLARFEDSDSVPYSLFSTLRVDQNVEILYAASDPTLSAVKADFKRPNPVLSLAFVGMGGLFTLIGLAMLYGGIRAQRNLRLLRSRGVQTQAILFDRWQDKDSDGDTTYFVAYGFKVRTRGGAEEVITRAEQTKTVHDKYQIGDSLVVYYLPEDPSICQVRLARQ